MKRAMLPRCPYSGNREGAPPVQLRWAAARSPLVVTNYDKWTSARMYGQGMNHFKQVIFDEGHCFVADTPVDGRPIEQIQIGDNILAFDEATGLYGQSKVVACMKHQPTRLLKLHFSDGSKMSV